MSKLEYNAHLRLVTTTEKPIPLQTIAVVADDRAQLLSGHEHLGNLLAAAPDLLEALRDCITDDGAASLVREDLRGLEMARRRLHAINEIARAAIAKAETPTC